MQSCTHTSSKRRRQKALGVQKGMPATSGTLEGRCGQGRSAALCIQFVEGDVCRETRHPFLLIKVRPNGNQNFPKGEFHFFKFSCHVDHGEPEVPRGIMAENYMKPPLEHHILTVTHRVAVTYSLGLPELGWRQTHKGSTQKRDTSFTGI